MTANVTDTFTANNRSYRPPRQPVLAICADGWDPGVRRRRAGALADAAPRRGAAGGRHATCSGALRSRRSPTPTTSRSSPASAPPATESPATITVTRDGARYRSPTRASCARRTIHAAAQRAGHRCAVRDRQGQAARAARDRRRAGVQRRARARADARRRHARDRGASARRTPDIYDWQLSPYTIDLAVALAGRLGHGSCTRR